MILTSPTTRAPATAEPATEKADPGETPKADATVREDQAAAETGATEAETVPDADWHPPKPTPSPSASADPDDNGVEETQDVDKRISGIGRSAVKRRPRRTRHIGQTLTGGMPPPSGPCRHDDALRPRNAPGTWTVTRRETPARNGIRSAPDHVPRSSDSA